MARIAIYAYATIVLIAGIFSHAQAAEFEKNILTGGPKGTYIQIGRDMAKLGAACGQTLNVQESAGSLENFIGVRNRKNTQFGIVQSDVLEYLKTYESGNAEIQNAVKGVRIMFPLYNEEIHLLARKDIASVRDLEGRKIAVGKQDSGTFLTASLVLDILRIKADRQKIGTDEAMEKLLAGEIDALFYVAGYPTALFQSDAIPADGFHLLPLDEPALQATYVPATIPAGTYGFQPDAVNVVAVKAVLMTYDYDVKKNAYHRESCKAVSDFSSLILTNLDKLRTEGHPKWKSVDLTDLPPGWQVGVCVKAGMALDYKVDCTQAEPVTQKSTDDEYLDLLKKRLNNTQ